ncbi:MAG: endonuclease/exonuclease/phosphatase family protein [Parachlamydiales bacterium]|jgi:endonuclease/exonuclease/phosphatase family metal-dependent hydrolase
MSLIKPIISNNLHQFSEKIHIEPDQRMPILFFQIASYLTDPICKAHEFYRRFQIVSYIDTRSYKISNYIKKIFLLLGFLITSSIAIPSAILGIAFRYFGSCLQKKLYIHLKGKSPDKILRNHTFNLLSWNICGISGGYSITDGGVMPIWLSRIKKISNQLLKTKCDVICLYEVFDINLALHLQQKLKKEYAHFYFNIGPNILGVSSGMFVASKFKIQNPNFSAFPPKALVGRTTYTKKGFFSFDLQSEKRVFAKIFSTHPQHSEECAYPTGEEKKARKAAIELIQRETENEKNKAVIVTGDLNLDDDEYTSLNISKLFEKKTNYNNKFTWGGDKFCATLVAKRASPGLNLDHTLVKKGSAKSIVTSLLETFYDDKKIEDEALSDHCGLISEIELN